MLIITSRSADGLSTNREAPSLYWQMAAINATTILLHFANIIAHQDIHTLAYSTILHYRQKPEHSQLCSACLQSNLLMRTEVP